MKKKKVRRLVLGVGYPFVEAGRAVSLYNYETKYVKQILLKHVRSFDVRNKIRLVVEVLK
jgi:hypothetical protein